MSPPGEESCKKCGKVDLIIYPYRGKNYCHECFRPIAEVVSEADKKYPRPLKDDDSIFWPGMDEETRVVMSDWVIANALIDIKKPELAYAWLKCQFIHPNLIDSFRKALGEPPLTPKERGRFSKKELQDWVKAVQEYLRWASGKGTIKR